MPNLELPQATISSHCATDVLVEEKDKLQGFFAGAFCKIWYPVKSIPRKKKVPSFTKILLASCFPMNSFHPWNIQMGEFSVLSHSNDSQYCLSSIKDIIFSLAIVLLGNDQPRSRLSIARNFDIVYFRLGAHGRDHERINYRGTIHFRRTGSPRRRSDASRSTNPIARQNGSDVSGVHSTSTDLAPSREKY